MKKIILSMILCAMAFVANAQVESIDIKGNFRSDFGLGVGLSADLGKNFEFSPNLNIYFWDGGTHLDLEGDFHYNIDLGKKFTFYPIVGGVICYVNPKDAHDPHGHEIHYDSETNLGIDIGCGLKYDFSKSCAGFMDLKYQWVNGGDDTYFALGVKLAI